MGTMQDVRTASLSEEVVMPGKMVTKYCRMLVDFRWFWLIFMVATAASSAPFAMKFPSACTTAFNPPPESMAMKGRAEMKKYFPLMDLTSDLVLYVEKKDLKPPVISDGFHNFSTELRQRGTTEWGPKNFVLSMTGYYSMLELVGPMGAANFLSKSPVNVSTFFDFRLRTAMTSPDAVNYSAWLKNLVAELQKKYHLEDCEFTLLGAPAFINTILDASSSDLEHMDSIVLPLAILILAWIVRSLRLLIAPLVALGVSTAVSFGIMDIVARSRNVFSGASALMMSVLIAMSIDYGLFLLTRYREELERGVSNELAVGRMIVSAGHTIVVSGLTLSLCFFGLTFLQNDFMVSVGMGCGIVLLCVLAMNLIVTPLLMLNFPRFFYRSLHNGVCCPPRAWCCSEEGREEVKQSCCGNADDDNASDSRFWNIQEGEGTSGASCEEETEYSEEGKLLDSSSSDSVDRNSVWYRFGDYVVRWPWNIVAVITVVGSVFYCCLFATTYKVTNNNMYYLPRNTDVQEAYENMGETFGFGQVWSFQFLLIPQTQVTGGAYSPSNSKAGYWERSQALIKYVEDNVEGTGTGNIAGALVAPYTVGSTVSTMNVSEELVGLCLSCRDDPASCPISFLLENMCTQCAKGKASCNDAICELSGVSPGLSKGICNNTEEQQEFYHSYCLPTPDPATINKTLCAGTLMSYDQFVDERKDATWVRFTPPFAPEGIHGSDWLHAAREVAKEFPQKFGIKMDIIGQPCDGIDAMDALYDEFPAMIGVTCAVVTIFVGIAFRSLFVPIRSVLTIALTIFFVQGFAALVYQHGALDWTGFSGFRSTNAVIYINPLLSFSIIVGVGLDYDIFLITRIIEYRKVFARVHPERSAFENTQEAIKVGLTKTAGIITAAGVIMAIAFSGLLLSKEPEMNQLAFYMVFAVIFDTFIVRPVLVPATMSLLFELNWWPCTLREFGTQVDEEDVESVHKDLQIN